MTEATPHQLMLGRQVAAATLIHEAKLKEHEAACLLNDHTKVEDTRAQAISAAEAVLDARERLYRSLPRE